MQEKRLQVSLPDGAGVSAIQTGPAGGGDGTLFVYAPGAGSNLRDPFGGFLASSLADAGLCLLRFQFPYMEAGRSLPDRSPVLETTWRAVIAAARERSATLVIGGRSMGGRIASQVVAGSDVDVAGLALFAYPLHQPGKPERTRDAHFASIGVPTLFCSGTRDSFATPVELEAAGAAVQQPTFHFIVGADHGFNVLKASGLTREDVWQEAAEILLDFLAEVQRD
jgi:predicted alpha/beta-hydrolase family hydrolase